MSTTRYQHLNETQLQYHFFSSNWRSHTYQERLELCQELENRLADQRGSQPRELVPEPMEGAAFGAQYHDKIYVNENILRSNEFVTAVRDPNTGQVTGIRHEDVAAPGWQMMDTIVHEDTHGMDEDNGEIQTASYIEPKEDYDLYRIQRSEKKAYEFAEDYTLKTIEKFEQAGITDPEVEEYLNTTGQYDYHLEEAKFRFNDEHVDETLEQVIDEIETGTTVKKEDRGAAYDRIHDVYDRQMLHRLQGHDRQDDPLEQYRTEPAQTEQREQTQQQGQTDALRQYRGKSASAQMSDYMNEHHYTIADQQEYMKDPQWQRLSEAYRQERGLRPLEQGPTQRHVSEVQREMAGRGIPEDSPEMRSILENERRGYDAAGAQEQDPLDRYRSAPEETPSEETEQQSDPLSQYRGAPEYGYTQTHRSESYSSQSEEKGSSKHSGSRER